MGNEPKVRLSETRSNERRCIILTQKTVFSNIFALLPALVLSVGLLPACAKEETSSKTVHYFDGCAASISLKELCETRPIIVRGTIAKMNRSVDVQNSVRTCFTIEVKEPLKGDQKDATVESYLLGGETATQIYKPISGDSPQVGEAHIFLIHHSGSFYPVYQIAYGKILLNDFSESRLYNKSPISGTEDNCQFISDDDVVAEIKDILTEPSAKQ